MKHTPIATLAACRLGTMGALSLLAAAGCAAPPAASAPASSSTIALTSDDGALWVVNPDADSVSVLDPRARALVAEIALAPHPPAPDAVTKRYEPSVKPRALAIVPGDRVVYVAGQSANRVLAIDAHTHAVRASIPVGAAPVAVVASPDGATVYAVCHEAGTVEKIDTASDRVVGTLDVGEHPWGAAITADGSRLYVTRFLRDPGVTVVDTARFRVESRVTLADLAPDPRGKLVPSGTPRGLYAVAARPGTGELWLPHLLLAVGTPEPDLDFQSTVFPTISTLAPDGRSEGRRLLFKPLDIPDAAGALSDVVSGPRAIAFLPDGKRALVAFASSEDVMAFDAESGNEVGLARPLPGAFLEGIAVDHAGRRAFVDGRNTHDVTVLALDTGAESPLTVDGAPIDRLAADPMPPDLRLGQRLFYTSNSAAFPITKNFWVACASCHLEGGTDAVTWRFTVGPRDTPSNAGGPINTGFLLRQALRRTVAEYDTTINVEQGGAFHRRLPAHKALLDALAAFVNLAIPLPENPFRAPGAALTDAQKRGQASFAARCASCHPGDYLTDSGAGNPLLDPTGPIVLHDVGTCVKTGPFPDQPAPDETTGAPHTACDFDTPTLRGIFATPPYLHDGSAATLGDAVDRILPAQTLGASERADLVEYLQTL